MPYTLQDLEKCVKSTTNFQTAKAYLQAMSLGYRPLIDPHSAPHRKLLRILYALNIAGSVQFTGSPVEK